VSTDLYTANLASITETELYSAINDMTGVDLPVANRPQEGYLIDFKERWGDKSLRVVAGFANTFGGIIIVGVSEDGGKADKIEGEPSASELKTRLADSISANISPTPLYDIAECKLPADPNRRLAVIRVRPAARVHYLLKKGEQPVYVRNEDQAIPAPAAELRQLIERERNSLAEPTAVARSAESLFQRVTVTNARSSGTFQERAKNRIKSQSSIKIAVIPEQPITFRLDYQVEDDVEAAVAKTFPMHYGAVMNGVARLDAQRRKDVFTLDLLRDSPDMESIWLVSGKAEWVYAAQFAFDFAGNALWSLPDLAIQLLNTIRAAHRLLVRAGYMGEAGIFVEVNPGVSTLHVENGLLKTLVFENARVHPWPQVIPQMPATQHTARATAGASSTFHTRTAAVAELLADILNQLLRDLNYAPDFEQLRQRAVALEKTLQTI